MELSCTSTLLSSFGNSWQLVFSTGHYICRKWCIQNPNLKFVLFLTLFEIYQVIYSSVVIFTALWSRIFLHRVLTTQHWQAIIIVTLGLSISTLGGRTNSAEEENSAGLFMLGAFFTLCATMMYSFHYVLSEKILTQKNPPTPQQLQTSAGVYVATLISIYLLCWTIPNFQELVVASVVEHNGHPQLIVFSYILLILSGFGHSVTFFKLMGSVGAVSTGILQSLRFSYSLFA